jgi:hypothetical protein
MSQSPNYNYKQVHAITPITEYYLDWFEKDQVSFILSLFSLDHLQSLGKSNYFKKSFANSRQKNTR